MHSDMVLLSHHPVTGEPADDRSRYIARMKAAALGEPLPILDASPIYWQPFDGGHRRVDLDSMATVCRFAGYNLRLIHNG